MSPLYRRPSARGAVLLLLTLTVPAGPTGAGAQEGPLRGCELCHAELELLRQSVGTLEEARTLLVSSDVLVSSAHDTMSCRSCHRGYERHPHPAPRTETEACASCHTDAADTWEGSVHAREEQAGCTDCHGTHDVLPTPNLQDAPGRTRMNRTCTACHDTAVLPPTDPHADSILCVGCHTAHRTAEVAAPGSSVAPLTQHETCGACHGDVTDSASADVHGAALRRDAPRSLAVLVDLGEDVPPTCTSCHGAHGMLAPSHEGFSQDMVDGCSACHADDADTYFGTYHGKATAVGSEIVATCDQCHGSHRIFPADDERSAVAEARLLETCGACHEHVRPAFVEYDSHPDPMNRERNPPLHFSFVFMNVLLFSVLGIFALHTGLWWIRLTLDKRDGAAAPEGGGRE